MRSRHALLLAALPLVVAACDSGPPAAPQYFDRVIQPILTASCVRNQGACHKDDGTGNALGNLDLSSYEALTRRPDAIHRYGSYPLPLLLLKATNGDVSPIPYSGKGDGQEYLLPVQIRHAGGSNIQANTNAFLELQKWLDLGATRDGRLAERPQQSGTGACNKEFALARPDLTARFGEVDTSSQAFADFANKVEPTLTKSCAFATCHSSEQSDFFVTCQGNGTDDASKFNFLSAQAFLSDPIDASQFLLRPLSPQAGGISHTGGIFFDSKSDSTWSNWRAWAELAGQAISTQVLSDGQHFFNQAVMPVFLQRGCALEGCHSPGAANDLKLRAGSGGFFAPFALRKNYESTREFLVPELADPRHSRIVKKPLVSTSEGGIGLIHRGGPPLQSPGDDLEPANCPSSWTEASSAFCTLVEWHRRERVALIAKGEADELAAGQTFPFAVVIRPPNADRLIDFGTFRSGADLQLGRMPIGASFATNPAGSTLEGSVLGSCPGVGAGRDNIDVRGPEFDYGADKIVFAMRVGEADTLDLYEVSIAAPRTCTRLTTGGAPQNGLPMHSLDPVYAPDGSLVFASTRGIAGGPTRSLKYLLPQTDLWRLPRVGDGYGPAEPMTSLRGSELSPAMMANGQVTFTAEKASADYYQLSGRRINWDLTDYHPLLAQRATSVDTKGLIKPSVDYQQATEIREGVDRNFVLILSDDGTRGAGGTVALFNRSIGPFEADRSEITFLRSLTVLDPAATGRAGATKGAYRSPALLPDGRLLVSYAPDVTDLAAASSVRYDLVVLDPVTGVRTAVAGLAGGASSYVEASTGYRRERRKLFGNFTQLVFGGGVDANPTRATVHYPDAPMLATLLGANLRSGRFVDSLRSATDMVIYAADSPPSDLAAAMAGRIGSQGVYDVRREIGRAKLAADGSVHLGLPALQPLYIELQDGAGKKLFSMSEQDQLGPGESITRGVPERFFNSVCGGCHGSVSGRELDIAIVADALTGASVSLSRDPSNVKSLGN